MNFQHYGGRTDKPVFKTMELYISDLLNNENVNNHNFFLSKNVIETMDDFFFLGQMTYEGEYYSIGKYLNTPTVRDLNDGMLLFKSNMLMHNEQYKFTRQIYSFNDFLGDLGGVREIIMISFGFLFYTFSEHSFYVTASS